MPVSGAPAQASSFSGRWIEQAGYRGAGPHREITLSCPADRDQMVTEIQVPVEQVAGGPSRRAHSPG